MATKTRTPDGSTPTGRPYDGTLRRERAAETRERILTAGSELLHREPIRDWKSLTVRAVADRAGVNERTVYRYFGNERGLRDALMQRNEVEAGIELDGMHLGDVGEAAAKIFAHVSQYPRGPLPPLVPTLIDARKRRHQALLTAVDAGSPKWPAETRRVAAAMLDVQWSVAAYEDLVENWELDHDQAVRGVSWVIGLIEEAVRAGNRP